MYKYLRYCFLLFICLTINSCHAYSVPKGLMHISINKNNYDFVREAWVTGAVNRAFHRVGSHHAEQVMSGVRLDVDFVHADNMIGCSRFDRSGQIVLGCFRQVDKGCFDSTHYIIEINVDSSDDTEYDLHGVYGIHAVLEHEVLHAVLCRSKVPISYHHKLIDGAYDMNWRMYVYSGKF